VTEKLQNNYKRYQIVTRTYETNSKTLNAQNKVVLMMLMVVMVVWYVFNQLEL